MTSLWATTPSSTQNRPSLPILRRPDEPGTLGEQLAAIALSLQLADECGDCAADRWDEARRRVRRPIR